MANRVRTRISFGAFANLKNNHQQQIGLNTIITSIKKIVSTFNNNFSYIVNSFNVLMQFKYDINKYGILYETTTENESISIEILKEKLEELKSKLDVLESGNTITNYNDVGISFAFKEYYPIISIKESDNNDQIKYWNNYITSSRINYIVKNKNNVLNATIRHQVTYYLKQRQGTLIFDGQDYLYAWLLGTSTNEDYINFTKSSFHFWTDKIKILKNQRYLIKIGTTYLTGQDNIPLGVFDLYMYFYDINLATDFSRQTKLQEITI